jgi:hypothetical protein
MHDLVTSICSTINASIAHKKSSANLMDVSRLAPAYFLKALALPVVFLLSVLLVKLLKPNTIQIMPSNLRLARQPNTPFPKVN